MVAPGSRTGTSPCTECGGGDVLHGLGAATGQRTGLQVVAAGAAGGVKNLMQSF